MTTRPASTRTVRAAVLTALLATAALTLGRCESDAPRIDLWSAPTIQETTR